MEKRKFLSAVFRTVFGVLLIIGAISLFITDAIAAIDSISGGDSLGMELAIASWIFGTIAAVSSVVLAVRYFLDVAQKRESDLKYIFYYVGVIGFDIALSAFVTMAVPVLWTSGGLWLQFLSGVVLMGLALACFVVKKELETVLGLITSAATLCYCFYVFILYAADHASAELMVWGVYSLAFVLTTVVFALRLLHPEEEETLKKPTEE